MKVYGPWCVFGAFWGAWGASIPAVREQAQVTDARLGTALLFVGLGALPAMAFVGRAIDRWGSRVTAVTITLFGIAGPVAVLAAHDFRTLCAGLLAVGATSGAADVSINALSADAEHAAAKPVIARSHATFSAAVVGGSVLTGLAMQAGVQVVLPFVFVLAGAVAVASVLIRRPLHHASVPPVTDADPRAAGSEPSSPTASAATLAGRLPFLPLVTVGLVAALAFAVENAHQSWSAMFLHDVLGSGPGLSAAAPAVFAAVASATRFASGGLGRRRPSAMLLAGGAAAMAGTVLVSVSDHLVVALAGLALAAAGTAILYPTLISAALSGIGEAQRGRATSRVATTAYLGFLAGPVYVGVFADGDGLRVAFLAVAALAALFCCVAVPAVSLSRRSARVMSPL